MLPYKTHIIRLKGHEHSEKMALECQAQAKKFGIDAQMFDGIYGTEAEMHYSITGVPRPKKNLKKGRSGVLGCFFSHYYLWKECWLQNKPFLILEHDGYIIRDIPNDIIDKFEDVLKLDPCDPFGSSYNSEIEDGLKKDTINIKKYINPTPKNPEKIKTGNYFKGAYAYMLKPTGAKKLLDFIHQNKSGIGHRTADQQIGDAVLNTWTTTPTVARLHPFYSEGNNLKTASLTGNPELL